MILNKKQITLNINKKNIFQKYLSYLNVFSL